MRYSNVIISSFGYELAPNVITSEDIEKRLEPAWRAMRLQPGQLEALTGIRERRYWDDGYAMHTGAAAAGEKAIRSAGLDRRHIGMLVYGGVCRDNLEPATACAVAHDLSLPADIQIYDVSNACLGVLNGMVQVANAIELGQIDAGLVVSCESSRQIMDITIERLLENPDMELFKKTVATLTGGSGAVAVLMAGASLLPDGHRLVGGVWRSAPEHHRLCVWGPDTGIPASGLHSMSTDSVAVLQNGVTLGVETYTAFRRELGLAPDQPDKIVCHQVGSAHQSTILEAIRVSPEKDFTTFRHLGNMGTVSLPITAAIAHERGFLASGDLVGFLGIGSGLNCLMLGIRW